MESALDYREVYTVQRPDYQGRQIVICVLDRVITWNAL